MKKALSVFLSILMVGFMFVPAFAAGATQTVTFTPPSADIEADAYVFAKTVNGQVTYHRDDNGSYIYYEETFMPLDNIFERFQSNFTEFYSPDTYTGSVQIEKGKVLTFKVMTSEKYNAATASVYINGTPATMNSQGEYSVLVDKNLTVSVREKDTAGNALLLRNFFNVKLTSGEGYSCRPLKGENYGVTYYGDDFRFRIKIGSGYSTSTMKVMVQRGANTLGEFLGEDADMLTSVMIDRNPSLGEVLTPDGVDADGCQTYTVKNVTQDCKIIVSGVRTQKSSQILYFLKRILKFILDALGIEATFLGSMTNYYKINVSDTATVEHETIMMTGTDDEFFMEEFNAMAGESINITLKSYDKSVMSQDRIKVSWDPGNTNGEYVSNWKASFEKYTGRVIYTATYQITNVQCPMTISITD
ncbi:MAG: hypothetical protein IJK02_10585 [Clostridia bacterium]|nr:hypothetical protein [Clostridia bacterium]